MSSINQSIKSIHQNTYKVRWHVEGMHVLDGGQHLSDGPGRLRGDTAHQDVVGLQALGHCVQLHRPRVRASHYPHTNIHWLVNHRVLKQKQTNKQKKRRLHIESVHHIIG